MHIIIKGQIHMLLHALQHDAVFVFRIDNTVSFDIIPVF